jgi:hypothetical protein
MTTTTPTPERRPGRPRKTAPIEIPAPADAQPPQVQYTIAKLTPHMLAGEIHRLAQEGEDITPIHQVSDAIRASQGIQTAMEMIKADDKKTPPAVAPEKIDELKAAVEAAKTSDDRPRTFAVAFHNKRGALRVAHGVEYEDGEIDIHEARGFAAQYADDMNELHEMAQKRHGNAYHVDYTDQA